MKILILGGDGMLGHQLFKRLGETHECRATLRKNEAAYSNFSYFNKTNSYFDTEVGATDRLLAVVSEYRPEVIINCIGIVKQRQAATDVLMSLEVNAALPHRVALIGACLDARVIHFSTDCVFSGTKGAYTESDSMDAKDLYGRTKFLGEISGAQNVTIRSSIIGPELTRKTGLFEWFMSCQGKQIGGYAKAIYSGFSTVEMSKIVALVLRRPEQSGIFQVASDPISKLKLLELIKDRANVAVEIRPDADFFCDRSLNGTRFNTTFDYTPPPWEKMIDEMITDYKQDSNYGL